MAEGLFSILDSLQSNCTNDVTTMSSQSYAGMASTSLMGAESSLEETNGTTPNNWTRCHQAAFYLNTLVIGSLCFVGLVGNTLSIFVLRKDKHNEIATFQLQVLAIADNLLLIVSFVVLFFFVGLAEHKEVATTLQYLVPYMKKYINPVGYITKSFAIWVTVLLAINRFIAVCMPFQAPRLLTKRRAQVQVIIVALVTFLLNLPRFFQVDVHYKNITVNGVEEHYPISVQTALGKNKMIEVVYFNAIYTSVVVILPLLLLCVFNFLLIKRLRKSTANMKKNSLSYSASQENNITRILIIIILAMLVCHTPDRIVTVLKYVTIDRKYWFCPYFLSYAIVFSNILIVINSSTNFFVYYFFRNRFRRILHSEVLPDFCTPKSHKFKSQLSWSINSNGNNHAAAPKRANGVGPGAKNNDIEAGLILMQNLNNHDNHKKNNHVNHEQNNHNNHNHINHEQNNHKNSNHINHHDQSNHKNHKDHCTENHTNHLDHEVLNLITLDHDTNQNCNDYDHNNPNQEELEEDNLLNQSDYDNNIHIVDFDQDNHDRTRHCSI